MEKDPYTATWVSYSSISDFLTCPQAYYLKNVYKDPVSNHKISLMTPALALGQVIHEVVESLSVLPVKNRFNKPLSEKYDQAWTRVRGKNGGFTSEKQENTFKDRGYDMIANIVENPGPLEKLAVKIGMDLPHYWLSEDEEIILCGKIDWLEYLEDTDGVHIIDFKTGRSNETPDSLQLPIYYLLATNCQHRKVKKVSYWYLERQSAPTKRPMPDETKAWEQVFKTAKEIALARKLNRFKCPEGKSCFACRPFQLIVEGEAEMVGVNSFRQDVYIRKSLGVDSADSSTLL